MKALSLAFSPTWWVKGRRKVRASPVLQTLLLLFMLLAMFGPLLNLLIWTVAESWYFPHSLPSQWGLKYWYQVFNPYSDVSSSLLTSVLIALLSVGVCLLISVPAGYALSRRKMPLRVLFMLLFLIPQAFPNLTVYMNIARLFYQWGLNGSIAGVVLVHSVHGLMYSVWICVAAFSSIDRCWRGHRVTLAPGRCIPSGTLCCRRRRRGSLPPASLFFWSRWMSLPAPFSSARRISLRCRYCSITPACRVTIRYRRLPR